MSVRQVDVGSLEGWLLKKKSKDKGISLFSSDNRRWFKIIEVKGLEHKELAFCYFKSQRDKEARGWIYLKDITEIYDDEKTFTLVTPSRVLCVSAQTLPEHRLWLRGLVGLCPWSKTSRIQTDLGAGWQQQQQQAKESAERPSGQLPANYFLDEKYRKLFAEGLAEKDEGAGSASASAAPVLRSDSREGLTGDYSLGERDDSENEGGDLSARQRRRPSNDEGSFGRRPSSEEGAQSQSRSEPKDDHRLSGSGYRNGGVATGRLHDHIRGGTRGGSLDIERNTSGGGGEDGEGVLVEDMNEVSTRRRRPRGGSAGGEAGSEAKGSGGGGGGGRHRSRASDGYADDGDDGRSNGSLSSDEEREGGGGRSNSAQQSASAPASAASGAVKKKKAPPPAPTEAPPPRRAADWVDDNSDEDTDRAGSASTQPVKQSIDAILKQKGSGTSAGRDSKGRGDDSDEEGDDVDFKAEKERRNMQTVTIHPAEAKEAPDFVSPTGSSRPPRPPVGSKAQAQGSKPVPKTASSGTGGRSSTPPRAGADPGSAVDADFAHEDWDEADSSADFDDVAASTSVRLAAGKKSLSTSAQAKPNRSFTGPVGSTGAGVKTDENWLNEDFDD